MTLYEIDQKLLSLIDPETGELRDYEAFEALQMEKTAKIENMALWLKDLKAEAKAIGEEINSLTERKRAAEAKQERLRDYLIRVLEGEKFTTPRVKISYRPTTAVTIQDEAAAVAWCEENGYDQYVTRSAPTLSKTNAKKILACRPDGIPGAVLETKSAMIIK